MADCCCPELASTGPSAMCGECGTAGRPVEPVTVKAMLTTAALSRYEHHAYRFCPDEGCSVVYFGEDGTVSQPQRSASASGRRSRSVGGRSATASARTKPTSQRRSGSEELPTP